MPRNVEPPNKPPSFHPSPSFTPSITFTFPKTGTGQITLVLDPFNIQKTKRRVPPPFLCVSTCSPRQLPYTVKR